MSHWLRRGIVGARTSPLCLCIVAPFSMRERQQLSALQTASDLWMAESTGSISNVSAWRSRIECSRRFNGTTRENCLWDRHSRSRPRMTRSLFSLLHRQCAFRPRWSPRSIRTWQLVPFCFWCEMACSKADDSKGSGFEITFRTSRFPAWEREWVACRRFSVRAGSGSHRRRRPGSF